MSEDPIGFGGGDFSLYRYVSNNPLSFRDPFGNFQAGQFFWGLGQFVGGGLVIAGGNALAAYVVVGTGGVGLVAGCSVAVASGVIGSQLMTEGLMDVLKSFKDPAPVVPPPNNQLQSPSSVN